MEHGGMLNKTIIAKSLAVFSPRASRFRDICQCILAVGKGWLLVDVGFDDTYAELLRQTCAPAWYYHDHLRFTRHCGIAAAQYPPPSYHLPLLLVLLLLLPLVLEASHCRLQYQSVNLPAVE